MGKDLIKYWPMKKNVQKDAVTAVSRELTQKGYLAWIEELKKRYRATQIKAAVAVNSALIEFYWNLGKDISEKYPGKVRDAKFFRRLSADLRIALPEARGLSPSSIKYTRYFYELYSAVGYRQQPADDKRSRGYRRQAADDKAMRGEFVRQLVCVPWGHHMLIVDKCKGDRDKALFYVRRTIQHGWSRAVLLNWISTDLYEREGRGQTNFELTMPSDECDLAKQLVKDPQVFEVFGLKKEHDEADLKAAIVANIEKTLLSLGKGVAFLGREYPVEIGGESGDLRRAAGGGTARMAGVQHQGCVRSWS